MNCKEYQKAAGDSKPGHNGGRDEIRIPAEAKAQCSVHLPARL